MVAKRYIHLLILGLLALALSGAVAEPKDQAAPAAVEKDTVNITPAEVERLVKETGSPKWKQREAATKKLIELAEDAPKVTMPPCLQTYASTDDPEIRTRLKTVLAAIAEHEFLSSLPGFLGINPQKSLAPVEWENKKYFPIVALQVLPNTPASENDLRPGDKFIKVDNSVCDEAYSLQQFMLYVRNKGAGNKLKLVIIRDNKQVHKAFKLAPRVGIDRGAGSLEQQRKNFLKDWLKQALEKLKKGPVTSPLPGSPKTQ